MRKLFFAALAGVFMLSSGFGTMTSIKEAGGDTTFENLVGSEYYSNCDFAFTYRTRNDEGEWSSETVFYSTWAMSDNSCANQAVRAAGMMGTVAYRHYRSTSIYE